MKWNTNKSVRRTVLTKTSVQMFSVCELEGIWGRDYVEIRAAKMASGVRLGPWWGKREEMGPEARLSCVYILRGSESGRVPILPYLPPPAPSLPLLSLCWPAPLCASQGRFLPQLGVLGCVAACLYWSVDFLVAACTYLNIPPAAALCSRPSTVPLSPPNPLFSSTSFISTRLTLLSLTPSRCSISPLLHVFSSFLLTVHLSVTLFFISFWLFFTLCCFFSWFRLPCTLTLGLVLLQKRE